MTAVAGGSTWWPVRSAARSFLTALSLAFTADQAAAQVYQLEAGSSSLFKANGGTVEVRTAKSVALFSVGHLDDRFAVGALFQRKVRDVTASVGDLFVNFDLPSDLFGGGHYLALRGARVERIRPHSAVSGFIGVTSATLGAPFFRGGTWGRPVGMLFVDHSLTPRWRFLSRNAISSRSTSIQAIEWLPRPSLTVALAGGVGNDRLYGSSSASVDYEWVKAKMVYASHPAGFRRLQIDSPMASEVERENVSVVFAPSPRWRLNLMRQNVVQEAAAGQQTLDVTINQFGGSVNAGALRLASSVYDSHGSDRSSLGASVTAGRQLTDALDVSADYFRYAPKAERASSSGVLTVRESVHPRLSLLQVMTRSNGQSSFNVGGEFLSNPMSVAVSYQTIYAPLRVGDPFVQVVGVDLRIHGPAGLELRAGTYATPDGRLKYTVSGRQIVSRSGDNMASSGFPKYQVRGLVIDVDANPVAGAVVQIGKDVVITDEDGRFSLLTAKTDRLAIVVLTHEFLAPGKYDVVSAPAQAAPTSEQKASELKIVVRRY